LTTQFLLFSIDFTRVRLTYIDAKNKEFETFARFRKVRNMFVKFLYM